MTVRVPFSRIPSTLIPLTLALFAGLLSLATAQNPHAGNYNGFFYIKNSGVIDLPEMGVGVFIATIDRDGTLRNGVNVFSGPSIGSVSDSGELTFTPALAGSEISKGQVANGVITASNTLNFPGLTQRYRLEASKTSDLVGGGGGGDGGGTPAPAINSLTPGGEINPNATVFLNVVAAPATGYQWFRGPKESATAIEGATSNFYNSPPLDEDTIFWVRVSNNDASTESDEIAFTLRPDPEGWTKVELPVEGAELRAVHGDLVVASTVTGSPNDSAAYLSGDRGATWTLVKDRFEVTDAFLDHEVRLYVSRNALWYTQADGSLAKASITPFPGNIGKIVRLDDGNLFFPSLQADGLFRSSDGGQTWNEVAAANLPPKDSTNYFLGTLGNRLFCGVTSRAAQPIGGLFYSDDQGATWAEAQGFPDDPRGPNQFAQLGDTYLARSGDGMIYASTDQGLSWNAVKEPSLTQLTAVVDGERFYWIHGQLKSAGVDLVEMVYDGPSASYPFQEPLFYSAPDLFVKVSGFGYFRSAVGQEAMDPGNGGGNGGDGGNEPASPEPLVTLPSAPPVFNGDLRLFEHPLRLRAGTVPLPAFSIEVRGLPSEVTVLNASRRLWGDVIDGRRSVEAFVIDYFETLAAGIEIDLNLQYGGVTEATAASLAPQFELKVQDVLVETLSTIRTQRADAGRALFQFPVRPGQRYLFRSSSDLGSWETATEFTAAGTLWEWLTQGVVPAGYFQLSEIAP